MENPSRIGKTVDISPPPGAFIESLRAMGYSLETALADIVDNSITAGAKHIDIFAEFNGRNSRIGILDDGSGMSTSELHRAMLLGGTGIMLERNEMDLGRFGFGLKTASISQGRRFTVVSRKLDTTATAATMDLDHIVATDRWEITVPDAFAVPWSGRLGNHGTLVVWEHLDRLIADGSDTFDAKEFNESLVNSIQHIELVFHRFLSGEAGLNKLDITVNGTPLKPLDPFFRSRSITTDPESIPYGSDVIRLQAFTLPHHSKVSREDWARHAGPRGYMRSQGFYVYRAKRLINYGSWFGIINPTELTKLSRIQLDVPNRLDKDWQIDVRKATVRPPRAVRAKLKAMVEPLVRPSKRAVTRRGVPLVAQTRYPVWRRAIKDGAIVYSIDDEHPAIRSFESRLDDESKLTLRSLIQLLGASLPLSQMVGDFADKPDEVAAGVMNADNLRSILQLFVDSLFELAKSPKEIEEIVMSNELFQGRRAEVRLLLQEILTIGEHAI